jgi:uncharacterized membrane protein YebE (DUF533 family)
MSKAADHAEILRAAICVAGIDGVVDDTERHWIEKLAAKIGVGDRSLEKLIQQAETDPDFYKVQLNTLQADPVLVVKALFGIAAADGVLMEQERVIIQHFAAKLGMTQSDFEKALATIEKHLDD